MSSISRPGEPAPNIYKKIKPIQTEYNGTWFRSRLEARWAIFMDMLEIPYRYEYEGFDVDGTWYVPDFYLPETEVAGLGKGCFLEIKPDVGFVEWSCPLENLALMSGTPVLLLEGPPSEYGGNGDLYFPDGGHGNGWSFCLDVTRHALDRDYQKFGIVWGERWQRFESYKPGVDAVRSVELINYSRTLIETFSKKARAWRFH